MGYRIKFATEEFYHVFNRGVDKRVIFSDALDYQRFMLLMLLANDTLNVDLYQSFRDYSIPELINSKRVPIVKIGAFTLMPNHYHFLISELVDGGISSFMHKIGTGYSMYFNMKNERSGALFQGRYKAKHLHSDNYVRYMYQYIHLNKIRDQFNNVDRNSVIKLLKIAEADPYSSLSAYSGREAGRLTESVIDKHMMFIYGSYKAHVENLLSWKEDPGMYCEPK